MLWRNREGKQVATITEWLASLGLPEYAQRFAENGIDVSVLRYLTDQDLEKIGVLLGHRRKLLAAIAELSGAAPVMHQPASPPEEKGRHDAERRQLTIMFTDLVGSTVLSTKLDPEDLRSIIGAYHKCVAETVARFDGFVAKYMGDGVLAYFGYPQAHEDDAERAVRAGLGLVEAVGRLRVEEPLQVRIGVATGLVVVGDLVGSGEAQERGVVGETPNLAARLQGIAAPNTVIIAEGTRRLLGDLFELEDLGQKDLKGIAASARAWAVLRARSVESRFEAMHATGLTALVGREEETELLLRRWSKRRQRRARAAHGRRRRGRKLACCSARARRRMQATYSSMPWCRTRPMARYYASHAARFTAVSPKCLKPSFPKSPRASRRCSRITAWRPA
jgi:class 3 adenylate cyclase